MAMADPARKVPEAAPATPIPKPAAATPTTPKTPATHDGQIVETTPAAKGGNSKEMVLRDAPGTPPVVEGKPKAHNISPGERGSNVKAEAFADAHVKRVEIEAQVFIDNEARKAEALCEKNQAIAERNKMKEEARAIETLKKEQIRADKVVKDAELAADKLMEKAREKSHMIKATAKEASEKHIANAQVQSDREKAGADEGKARRMAEIRDHAETMIAAGELIPDTPKKAPTATSSLKRILTCSAS